MDNNEFDTDDELTDSLIQNIEFEQAFYSYVADTDDFNVLLIPDEKGYIIPEDEKKMLLLEALTQGVTVLYRISIGKYATVWNPKTNKLGIVPENHQHGFEC